jgi:hypothetical protein
MSDAAILIGSCIVSYFFGIFTGLIKGAKFRVIQEDIIEALEDEIEALDEDYLK